MSKAAVSGQRHFVFVLSSSRSNGNSEQLARLAAQSLGPEVKQTWINLQDTELPDFEDIRHQEQATYELPGGSAGALLSVTLEATDLVLVTPLYWYSLPTLAKRYLDHWSGWMRIAGIDFRERMQGKRLWNVISMSDEDTSYAEPLVASLKLSAAYMQMEWRSALIGYGNRPADVLQHPSSVEQAKAYFV